MADQGQNQPDAISDITGTSGSSSATSQLRLKEYNFNHDRRGVCLIINNKTFRASTGQSDRVGSDVDADNIYSTFAQLGFETRRYDDLTATDLSLTMRKVADEDHSDADCFVCVILSHGKDGRVYGTDGTITIDSIVQRFKGDVCSTLAGKPKLFFLQACRGNRLDYGVDVLDSAGGVDTDEVDSIEGGSLRTIPVEADLLLAYSVVPGYYSWRNNVDGSWFVQALCRVLREMGDDTELMYMMTLVNSLVASDFRACTDSEFTQSARQMPCLVSMLTAQVFFRPK